MTKKKKKDNSDYLLFLSFSLHYFASVGSSVTGEMVRSDLQYFIDLARA